MSDSNPELARLIKERDEARLWEKDALFDLGRLSEQLRLLARGVIREDPEVKEIASDLLTGGRPKVLVEAQEGGRIRGWGAEFLARMFVEELERHGAENFVEWTMESVGLKVLVTIQRLDGSRPTEIIAELKAECERLRRERDAATEEARVAADRAAAAEHARAKAVAERDRVMARASHQATSLLREVLLGHLVCDAWMRHAGIPSVACPTAFRRQRAVALTQYARWLKGHRLEWRLTGIGCDSCDATDHFEFRDGVAHPPEGWVTVGPDHHACPACAGRKGGR